MAAIKRLFTDPNHLTLQELALYHRKTTCTSRKRVDSLLPVDGLKKNHPTIIPRAKDFYEMWKRACDTAAKCIAEVKECNKQRWDKSHMEHDFRGGDQLLVSKLNFNNRKGPKKMRDTFGGPFTIMKLIGRNAVDVKLTEEFSRKHPVFPVSLVKPHFQTEDNKLETHRIRNSRVGGFPWTCEENNHGQEDQT
ncbi:hypothetical protein O181_097565 [Austropuccinia psidii MF-1]|uniref:Tf2-1-like SH3-like domain-containing protein n=1 Tax=Austropuccinia psidii MF-1 TaxID=1389203 RepID=A0A9Q3J7P1_9BASI|nr:hypothetical protein [Austropuccinia psidii MF-1]